MKKWIMTLMLLACAFILAFTPVLAETAAQPSEGWVADSIDGIIWQDDRASLEVIPQEGSYKVLIMWSSSAWEMTEWTYICSYDAEARTLTAVHMICDEVSFDEAGIETRTNIIDVDCETTFSLNDQGQVVIQNAADDSLEGKTFTRIPDESDTEAVG